MKYITTLLLSLLSLASFSQNSWVNVELLPDNYAGETSWEIYNSDGDLVATNPTYTSNVYQGTIIPLDAGDYNFVINDSYGDGICCEYGEGWFGLTNDCGLEEYVYDFATTSATVFFTLEQCAQPPPPTIGCMDSTAINYNPEASQNSYMGLVTAPAPPSNCNQVAWTNNYFGVEVDYYIENLPLFAVGTEISVSGYTYFIDGSGIPNNCNAGVATIYVVYEQDQADGDVSNTYIPQALYNDVLIGDTWSINPCEYIYGCNNELANNYDPIVTTNDGSCIYITGCTDPEATNYNPAANLEFAPGTSGPPPCQYFVLDTTSCGTDSVELIVSIVVDQYPSETSWWVKASWGETLAEIFPGDYAGLSMGTEVNTTFCVADGTAITFMIEDTYGDGLGGAQWGGIDGTWAIYTACDTIGNGGGNFGPATLANGNVGDCDDLPIGGCMDNSYLEYNPEAVIDDGDCLTLNVYGCIEENSINYNPEANTAEQFSNCSHTLNLTDLSANGWGGSFLMVIQGEDSYGPFTVPSGDLFTTTLDLNSNELIKAFFYSDPLSANFMVECGFEIVSPSGEIIVFGGDNPILNPIKLSPYMYSGLGQCLETCIPMVYGCTDANACNYDPLANTLSTCTYNIEYYNCNNQCINDNDGDGVCDELEIEGCQDPLQYNFNPSATDTGECEPFIYGCTDNTMFNYSAEANSDNDSCEPFTYGCTNEMAFNYNPAANAEYDPTNCVPFIYGCTDPSMLNYDPEANTEDFSCITILYGCIDPYAFNYDPEANTDNGSCIDILEGCIDQNAYNYNEFVNTDDGSCLYDAGCVGEPGDPYWLNDGCYAWVIDVSPNCCNTAWNGGCQDLYNYCEVNDETVGMVEYGNTQITVFPNPTTGFINIATSLQVDISIYNAFGQLVLQENNAKQVDITTLSDGIYQMILTYDGNKFTKKIIKQ